MSLFKQFSNLIRKANIIWWNFLRIEVVIFPRARKVRKKSFQLSSRWVFRRKIDKLSTNQNVMDENTVLNILVVAVWYSWLFFVSSLWVSFQFRVVAGIFWLGYESAQEAYTHHTCNEKSAYIYNFIGMPLCLCGAYRHKLKFCACIFTTGCCSHLSLYTF